LFIWQRILFCVIIIHGGIIEGRYNEDCVEGMKRLPDESVDLVFADPPYMISSSVKIHRRKTKWKGKDISYKFGDWDVFKNIDEYLRFTEQWFKLYVRKLRDVAKEDKSFVMVETCNNKEYDGGT